MHQIGPVESSRLRSLALYLLVYAIHVACGGPVVLMWLVAGSHGFVSAPQSERPNITTRIQHKKSMANARKELLLHRWRLRQVEMIILAEFVEVFTPFQYCTSPTRFPECDVTSHDPASVCSYLHAVCVLWVEPQLFHRVCICEFAWMVGVR